MKHYISPEIEVFAVTAESPVTASAISANGSNDDFYMDDSFDWD